MNATKNRYRISVGWSHEDDCFIATAPAFPHIIADGDTLEEAIKEIQQALNAAIETLASNGYDLPSPSAEEALDTLRRFYPVLNVSALAKRAHINKSTLASKLRRGTAFTEMESRSLLKALRPRDSHA